MRALVVLVASVYPRLKWQATRTGSLEGILPHLGPPLRWVGVLRVESFQPSTLASRESKSSEELFLRSIIRPVVAPRQQFPCPADCESCEHESCRNQQAAIRRTIPSTLFCGTAKAAALNALSVA